MRLTNPAWTLLTVVLVAGCSNSDLAEVAETTDQLSGALASALPIVKEFDKAGSVADDKDEPITPFDENVNLFTPPKMIIPMEVEEPEEDGSGELPPLRLVGFVGTAGDKAMVNVGGKMHIVAAGKRLNGVEIVSVKSPNVELRWGETELTLNFYKPSKADRPKQGRIPSMSFSPGLSNVGNRPEKQIPFNAAVRATPAPRPQVSLPTLPGLPTPDDSAGADVGDFPDLGVGPGAPPAP